MWSSPRCTGLKEVTFAVEIFDMVEDILGLPRNTVKLGIMDEERRTSVPTSRNASAPRNPVWPSSILDFWTVLAMKSTRQWKLAQCCPRGTSKIRLGSPRTRTETLISGWPVACRAEHKSARACGPCPIRMGDMLEAKIGHPMSGANLCLGSVADCCHTARDPLSQSRCAWRANDEISADGGARGTLDDLLTIPLLDGRNLSDEEIGREIRKQRPRHSWIRRALGRSGRVGCSKVPDINDVGLMEDRATCRISSQALANWLHHGVVGRSAGNGCVAKNGS